ncbi:MAG: GNAT family N-acetyltransferase [Deltaproteobacteria bacterium]|nr:GNAT family N-acetyltransferase [Deltaproteobacteria bacterium]
MNKQENKSSLEHWKKAYPEKFASEEVIFGHIRRGDHIFVTSGCGEPQYLLSALTRYVESHPKAFFDTEIIQVYSLGIAPYTDPKFKSNFRHNSFFIGNNTRDPVNRGAADYTPVSLSDIPALINGGIVRIDVALIQTSMPDEHGFLSLGVSVDMVKAATEKASMVIAQVNSYMPRVHGDGFINVSDVNYIIHHDSPVLEIQRAFSEEKTMTLQRIGNYVARLIQDGDTLQVGYGSIPNAIMAHLYNKKHLGVHTELLTEGLVNLIKVGVINNSKKILNRGKTIATFCMAKKETYEYIHDNPAIVFRTVDYTNDPLLIARNDNMVAINSALEIDLTGQATSESIGSLFYSGIGGFQDFMRGALLARNGKTILAMKSTAVNDTVSRIVPHLNATAGVTLNRADVHYVVTEYGIAYLHGKNIRERAMALISIAHPKFRSWLIEEAKRRGLIYQDQAFIPGERGRYPEDLEVYRTTKTGFPLFLRPVKITDEPLLKDFFYSLSDRSLHRRFLSWRTDIPHERLQDFVVIDYTKEISILAMMGPEENQVILGIGQYGIDQASHTAEVALVVRDDYQGRGIGSELLSYLTYLAKREGLLGFTAEVLMDNKPMLQVFEQGGFDIERRSDAGVYHLKMAFKAPEGRRIL